jgi:hypothetical protein
MRAASDEAGDGFALRDVRSMVNRLDGYVSVTCSCGLKTNVPMNFERNEVHCVRCGSLLALPAVHGHPATSTPSEAPTAPADLTPLEYTRGAAGWESFRCQCGHTLQLSPSFRGTHLNCNKCRRRIDIVPLAA